MQPKLAEKLLENNVLKFNTQVTANIRIKELSGSFVEKTDNFFFRRAIKTDTDVMLILERKFDGKLYKVKSDNVKEIEGMELDRIAKAYELDVNGEKVKQKLCPITGEPVRRGRKPNWVKEKMKEMDERLNR